MSREELYKQSLQDLLRVVVILSEILEKKEIDEEEQDRINYGTKVLKNVTEKQNIINNLK